MNRDNAGDRRLDIFFMVISAALFGCFGFAVTYNYYGVNGQFLFFVALLEWTLKISAIAFGLTAILTMALPLPGVVLYGVVGLLSAAALLVAAALDLMDPQHTAMSPFILIILALWNGYASISGLRDVLAARRRTSSPAAGTE